MGFRDFASYLSTSPDKYARAHETWDMAEDALRRAHAPRHLHYRLLERRGPRYRLKVVLMITEALGCACQVAALLGAAGLPVHSDDRRDRMGSKIRDAQLQKVPYMLIMGDKEMEAGAVAVRLRSGEDLGAIPLDQLKERMVREVQERTSS